MENNKKRLRIGKLILVEGILLAVLGIVHLVVTYFEYQRVAQLIPHELATEFAIWFFATGIYILFAGMINIYSFKGLQSAQHTAWRMSFLASLFMSLTGLCGMIGFKFAPGPPYFLFLSGLICVVPLLKNRGLYIG